MRRLRQKIEANASQRLLLPAGRKPHDEVRRYKQFIKVESHRLKMAHRAGGGGLTICRARSTMLDSLLESICESQIALLDEAVCPRLAIVAIGGGHRPMAGRPRE